MSDIALRVLTRNNVNKTPKLAKIESGRSYYKGCLYPTVDVIDDETLLPEENSDGTPAVIDPAKDAALKESIWAFVQWRGRRDIVEILQDEINRCGQDSMFASALFEPLVAGEKEGTDKPIVSIDWPGALNRLEKITERTDSIPKLQKKVLELVNASAKLFDDPAMADIGENSTPAEMLAFIKVREQVKKNRVQIKAIEDLIERKRRSPKVDDTAEATS